MKAAASLSAKSIASAKALLNEGKRDEAQCLLLDRGYIEGLDTTIQDAYLKLIPVNPTLRILLEQVYSEFENPDPKLRYKAVDTIARELIKERLRDKTFWMRDPRAADPLIAAVSDPDTKVSECALFALSRLVGNYFPDRRTFRVFLGKLADPSQQARTYAISGIACLGQDDQLFHLVDLLVNGTDDDRAEVSRQIWGAVALPREHASEDAARRSALARSFWRDMMVLALCDTTVRVREHAARGLELIGDKGSIPALQAAKDREGNENAAYYMGEAIEAIGLRE